MSRVARRLVAALVVVAAVVLGGGAAPAAAHPLGNFTTNVSAAVVIGRDRVLVDYVVDHAEVPTVQLRARIDADGDGEASDDEATDHAERRCAELASGIDVTIGARRVPLEAAARGISFVAGEAGLDTARLECTFTASTAPLDGATEVAFLDRNLAGTLGWREVIAVGDRVAVVTSDVPATSATDRLRSYPDNRLASPLDQRAAAVTVRPDPDAPAAAVAPGGSFEGGGDANGGGGLTGTLTSLNGERELGLGVGALAVAIAVVLGALHSLAPGHGKTVIAAYVVGQRGTLRQIVPLGLTVAVTHTVGVVVLGLVLWTSEVATPERLFPLLSMASGALVVGIGGSMLLRAVRRRRVAGAEPHDHHDHPHPHSHGHGHGHGHSHSHGHGHSHGRLEAMAASELRTRDLLALGLAGGMVPTPSALLVLLGSLALGHAWFGVLLVLCYGVGMTATLVGAGLLLVRGWATIERWLDRVGSVRVLQVSRLLPVGSASVIVAAGVFLVARSAMTV